MKQGYGNFGAALAPNVCWVQGMCTKREKKIVEEESKKKKLQIERQTIYKKEILRRSILLVFDGMMNPITTIIIILFGHRRGQVFS